MNNIISELQKINPDWIVLSAFVTIGIILLEVFFELTTRAKKRSGLSAEGNLISNNNLISEKLSLAGKPDAITKENGLIIPIEFKPSSEKVKNRYVMQMIVYLRLIEEIYQSKPPYGYLILGKNKRRVILKNTQEKHDKLDKLLEQMKDICLEKRMAIASPEKNKCEKCPAKHYCSFKV